MNERYELRYPFSIGPDGLAERLVPWSRSGEAQVARRARNIKPVTISQAAEIPFWQHGKGQAL